MTDLSGQILKAWLAEGRDASLPLDNLADTAAGVARDAVTAERERCYAIVEKARFGEIDGDFRSLLHRIESQTPVETLIEARAMRIVVMDKEMREPLTIVDIPAHLMRQVEDGMPCIVLPVPASFQAWVSGYDFVPNAPITDELRRVVLRMEKIVKSKPYPERGCEILFWTATPDDEELALLLRAAFLPGQITELRRREMQQWFMGALGAPPPQR